MTITNTLGNVIDFDVAVLLMDDSIRERVSMEIAPCTEQEFFDRYCALHLEQYGSEFELAEDNPCY